MQTYVADTGSIAMMLQTVIALIVIAVFVMAIVSFIMAIWDFLQSQGDQAIKDNGLRRIRFMMIGVVLIVIFLIGFPLLLRQLGVIHYELFLAPNIFARVGELLNYILSIGTYITDFGFSNGGVFQLRGSSTVGVPQYSL